MHQPGGAGDHRVGLVRHHAGQARLGLDKPGQTLWQQAGQRRAGRDAAVAGPRRPQACLCIGPPRQINHNRLALMPVAGGLQHRRAGQAAMGKQHRLVKAGTPGGHAPLYRHAGQRFETFQLLLGKGQRHQTGPRFGHMQAKLFGQPVAKGAGPHLWN